MHISEENLNDWYHVTDAQVAENGGSQLLLQYYDNSLGQFLGVMYPNHAWEQWKFSAVPANYWENVETQKKFVEWLSQELKIEQLDSWYDVSVETVAEKGGAMLLEQQHHNSLFRLLRTVYPDHNWLSWKFRGNSMEDETFWESIENQKEYLEWLRTKTGVKDMEDWYDVTLQQITEHGGAPLLAKYNNSIGHVLTAIYPDYEWVHWKFPGYLPDEWWYNGKNLRTFMQWLIDDKQLSGPRWELFTT